MEIDIYQCFILYLHKDAWYIPRAVWTHINKRENTMTWNATQHDWSSLSAISSN